MKKNIDDVIKKQRKKGIKLKKKNDLDQFIKNMQNEIRLILLSKDDWSYPEVNLYPRWFLYIEDQMGLGFKLPGFETIKLHSNQRENVVIMFKKQAVTYIQTSIDIAKPWDTDVVYPYTNKTLQFVVDVLTKYYGTHYIHSRKSGSGDLGEKQHPQYSEYFTFSDKKTELNFSFNYKPYGILDKERNWRYLGTSLQELYFTAFRK